MGFFERALEERGIPAHVVGGRGYFAQQQVSDLRHWLAALANPLDELALYSVLASPLGGLSLDARGAHRPARAPLERATRGGSCASRARSWLEPAAGRATGDRLAAAFVEPLRGRAPASPARCRSRR